MPGGREKPLHLQSTTDLWVGIIGFPAFLSFFVAIPLGLGPPKGGTWWTNFWLALFLGGFAMLVGVLLGVPRLKELRRRGEWVPRGVNQRPVLVSIVLVFLIMAAVVAGNFIMHGVAKLAVAAGLREVYAGLLGSVVFFLLAGSAVFFMQRFARKPPASEDNDTTKPSSSAECPPE